jgi:hypothetical protein
MSRIVCRAGLAVAVVAAGLGTTAPAAGAQTGTPAAKRLAKQIVSAYKKVAAVETRQTGDIYYCDSVRGGFLAEPAPGCRKKATASYTRILSKGRVTGGFGTTSARGEPTIEFVSRRTGTFHRMEDASCWTRIDTTPRFSGPAFAFFPSVRLSISKTTGNTYVLRGEDTDFLELLTVRKTTKLVTREEFRISGRRTVLTHANRDEAPDGPSPTPLCDES